MSDSFNTSDKSAKSKGEVHNIFQEGNFNPSPKTPAYDYELRLVIVQKFVDQIEKNKDERVKYAKYTFVLTCCWLAAILIILVLAGIQSDYKYYGRILKFNDRVLLALITTTTINVFGYFLLVMKFLFNKQEMMSIETIVNGGVG